MLETEIKVGEYSLVESKTLFSFSDDDKIEINLKFNSADGQDPFNFKIIFIYEKDCENKEKRYDMQVDKENMVETFKLINFDNVLGTGLIKPINVCTYGGKKYYIFFWSYKLEKSGSKLMYNIYKED